MDSRDTDNPDWKYVISTQNNGTIEKNGKVLPLAMDIRNGNSRAILDRDLLGNYINKIGFPDFICWLMKDSTLPPIIKCSNPELGVAMGATLMTKRSTAENVSMEEMKKLVFEPFANPFRVYELVKDIEGFLRVLSGNTECYVFNSGGYWKSSDTDLTKIPLKLSLTLQSKILTGEIEWQPWELLPGAMVPKASSIDLIWPGYSKLFSFDHIANKDHYLEYLKDRFEQRRQFLLKSDVNQKPELLKRLLNAFVELPINQGND
jgi:phosphoenolpyruvate carboxykinase (ATP)